MKVLHNSCNTATRGLPDMSTLSPWAALIVPTDSVYHFILLSVLELNK